MQNGSKIADEARSVAAVYEDGDIAQAYLDKRLRMAWQRLSHDKQVAAVNEALSDGAAKTVLEIAPGPARLTTEIRNVKDGVLVENSEEMIRIARARLAAKKNDSVWSILSGDAFELDRVLAGRKFDLAYTFRFIRHFRRPEREKLYGLIRQHLLPGGLLVFDVVNETVRKRLDAQGPKPAGEIAIYDATYSRESFQAEMRECGFEVVRMSSVLGSFEWQSWLSYKWGDFAPRTVSRLVHWLERGDAVNPLEWIAVCRKL